MKALSKISMLLFLFCICFNGMAQKGITDRAEIEYERRMNLLKLNENNEWYLKNKEQIGQFNIAYFNLIFYNNKSIYRPGREAINKSTNSWFVYPANDNIVYTDFGTGKVSAKKNIYEESYLVSDTLLKCEWRITDEFRNILGYDCRKAVTKIKDSVTVIAFYTDQIAISAGPEGFSGLPGAILGLAIPKMHTTWYATKINTAIEPETSPMEIPAKGTKTTPAKLESDLRDALKDWGNYINMVLLFTLI